MTPDEAIAAVRLAASGRTRYERSEPWRDEVLVMEIERLRRQNEALIPAAKAWMGDHTLCGDAARCGCAECTPDNEIWDALRSAGIEIEGER